MKNSFINRVNIEGYLYSHKLEVKTVQNNNSAHYGENYIGGSVSIAVDDAGTNVIEVFYRYIPPVTKAGKDNLTYAVLNQIINEDRTWEKVGKDNAFMVKASPSVTLNDFYVVRDDRMVAAKRLEGGFLSIVNTLAEPKNRNTFATDMLITKADYFDVDEEKNITQPQIILSGYIFDFRKSIMPVDYVLRIPQGVQFFAQQEISPSEPLFAEVRGNIISTVSKTTKEEETIFGTSVVKEYVNVRKEYEADFVSQSYEFDDEATLTFDEVNQMLQDREVKLAEVKQSAIDYAEKQNAKPSIFGGGAVTVSGPSAAAPQNKEMANNLAQFLRANNATNKNTPPFDY